MTLVGVRVHYLHTLTSQPEYDRQTAIDLYEALDVDITWATGSNGAHSFSPAFSDTGNSIRHWKRQIKLTLADISLDHVLIPSQVIGVLSYDQYLTFCRQQLAAAWTIFRAIKTESKERRQKYLDACLADAIDEVHRANTLRKIISAEAAAQLYQRLRFFIKGTSNSSIGHVLIPDDADPTGYRRVSEQELLFHTILARNLKHFGQAAETPFVDGSQGARAPPFEYTAAHESMLHGDYIAENAEFEEVQQFVDALKRPEGISDLSSTYGTDSFIAGWRGLSEKTSSSPSGRYIGLYKALIDNYENNDETVSIFSIMSAVPIRVGFCPTRWAKALQVMLCKKEGNFHIHRLRVIQLLEADLNMIFRYFWCRQMVHNAQNINSSLPSSLAIKLASPPTRPIYSKYFLQN
jgi:hypothetical protein